MKSQNSLISKKLSSNKVINPLNKHRRRIIRIIRSLMNPILLIAFFMAVSILTFAYLSVLSIGQLVVGLPVSCLVIYWFFQILLEEYRGEYEKIVVRTNRSLYLSDFSNTIDVFTDFSAGFFLLNNIQLIDSISLPKGMRRFSYFYEDSKNPQWHDPKECINTLLYIKNSLVDFIESPQTENIKRINSEIVIGIQQDCEVFISICESLEKNNLLCNFSMLSQSGWTHAIHHYYNKNGYCI